MSEKAILYSKMAQVMSLLSRVKETGRHQQGWTYATSEDVKDAVRNAMSAAGLALLVNLDEFEIIPLDKGQIVRGKMAFTLACGETGQTETRHLWGEAVDFTKASDKAFYKLYTTLEKYFLKTTFLISSGDDFDGDADDSNSASGTQVSAAASNEMTLAKLLINLDKVRRIKGFYSPSSIMACRPRSAEPPAADDMDGWRQLFTDARDYAFEQLDQQVAGEQSAMDEVEAHEQGMLPALRERADDYPPEDNEIPEAFQ
jgi:hypothetical protein